MNPKSNETGFSLLSVVIAAGLAGVVVTSLMAMLKMANDQQKAIDQKMAVQNIVNTAGVVLQKTENCLASMGSNTAIAFSTGISSTTISIDRISRDDSTIVYSALTDQAHPNSTYENGNIQVESMTLKNYQSLLSPTNSTDSKFYTGTAILALQLKKVYATPGAQIYSREIPLKVTLVQGGTNDKKIQSCSTNIAALLGSGASSDFWQPSVANDGIYYLEKVGIGISTPEHPFHVKIPIPSYTNTYFARGGDSVYAKFSNDSGGVMEIRSQGIYQTPYLVFRDYMNRDTFSLMPAGGGIGATSFTTQKTFWFSVDAYRWGLPDTAADTNTYIDFESVNKPGLTATSGEQSFMRLMPTVTQTGSANYSAFLIDTKENSTGSGYKKSILLRTNGAEIFSIASTGEVNSSNCYKSNGTVVGGTCTSDERLKKNIGLFDLGLKELLQITPKTYQLNGDGGENKDELTHVGLIAQEVELASRDLVGGAKVKLHENDSFLTDIKTVHYSKLIYVVINAIKEFYSEWKMWSIGQDRKIDQKLTLQQIEYQKLENEVNELKKILLAQKNEIEKLKQKK